MCLLPESSGPDRSKAHGNVSDVLSIPLLGLPFEMLFTMLRLCRIKEKYLEMSFAILITGGIWAMSSAGRIKEERYYSITISEADMRVSLDLCGKITKSIRGQSYRPPMTCR